MIKKISMLLLSITIMCFVSCGENNPVESAVISNEEYCEREDIESATQADNLPTNEDINASIYFIESPKGSKYTATWYINDTLIKKEEKLMGTDVKGSIIYTLPKEDIKSTGVLKLEISSKNSVLLEKEVNIK